MSQFNSGSAVIKDNADIVNIKLESHLLKGSKVPPATAAPMLTRHHRPIQELPTISKHQQEKRIDVLNKKFYKYFKHIRRLPIQQKIPEEEPQVSPKALISFKEHVISSETM
jgi:hypothetical protein